MLGSSLFSAKTKMFTNSILLSTNWRLASCCKFSWLVVDWSTLACLWIRLWDITKILFLNILPKHSKNCEFCFKLKQFLYLLPQIGQGTGSSVLLWVYVWALINLKANGIYNIQIKLQNSFLFYLRCCGCLKALLHWLHLKGLSSECIRKCCRKLY